MLTAWGNVVEAAPSFARSTAYSVTAAKLSTHRGNNTDSSNPDNRSLKCGQYPYQEHGVDYNQHECDNGQHPGIPFPAYPTGFGRIGILKK